MLFVLVIEDDKTINSLLCSIITKSGYSVDSDENGLAATVLAAAGFFLGLLKLPENLDTAAVFSLSICDASFMFIISLVAAWFAGNDFHNRTIHNEKKAGYSRFSVFMARTITTVIMAVVLHLTYVFATVVGFSVKCRFDSSIFSITDFVWLLVVMLQIGRLQGSL